MTLDEVLKLLGLHKPRTLSTGGRQKEPRSSFDRTPVLEKIGLASGL